MVRPHAIGLPHKKVPLVIFRSLNLSLCPFMLYPFQESICIHWAPRINIVFAEIFCDDLPVVFLHTMMEMAFAFVAVSKPLSL